MAKTVSFFVPGIPAPGGSKKAFAGAKTGRIIVTDDSGQRGRNWRACVADQAALAMQGREPFGGPLRVSFWFTLPRPKGHYGTGKNAFLVKKSAPKHPAVKPDATKLVRAAEDACTGILWRDDTQVIEQIAMKKYGPNPGLYLRVEPLEG